jgi:hypothetical protein
MPQLRSFVSARRGRAVALLAWAIIAGSVLAGCLSDPPPPKPPTATATATSPTRIFVGSCLTPGHISPGAVFPVRRFAIEYKVTGGHVVVAAMNVGWKLMLPPESFDPKFPDVSMRTGARATLSAGATQLVNVAGNAHSLSLGDGPATYAAPGARAANQVPLSGDHVHADYPGAQVAFVEGGPSDLITATSSGGTSVGDCRAAVELPVSGCGYYGGGPISDPASPIVKYPVFRSHGKIICGYQPGVSIIAGPGGG